MYKSLLIGLVCASSAVHAETYNVNAKVIDVRPVYNQVTFSDPVNSCRNVSVPMYGNSGPSNPIDTLFGAVLGGAIGNQFGSGNGQDAMTVLGAIFGADVIQNNNRPVVGYQNQQKCDTNYVRRVERVIDGYDTTYSWNGLTGVTRTKKKYKRGTHMPVRISFN